MSIENRGFAIYKTPNKCCKLEEKMSTGCFQSKFHCVASWHWRSTEILLQAVSYSLQLTGIGDQIEKTKLKNCNKSNLKDPEQKAHSSLLRTCHIE